MALAEARFFATRELVFGLFAAGATFGLGRLIGVAVGGSFDAKDRSTALSRRWTVRSQGPPRRGHSAQAIHGRRVDTPFNDRKKEACE